MNKFKSIGLGTPLYCVSPDNIDIYHAVEIKTESVKGNEGHSVEMVIVRAKKGEYGNITSQYAAKEESVYLNGTYNTRLYLSVSEAQSYQQELRVTKISEAYAAQCKAQKEYNDLIALYMYKPLTTPTE